MGSGVGHGSGHHNQSRGFLFLLRACQDSLEEKTEQGIQQKIRMFEQEGKLGRGVKAAWKTVGCCVG